MKRSTRVIEQWTGKDVRIEREGGTVVIQVHVKGNVNPLVIPLPQARELSLVLADAVAFDTTTKGEVIPHEPQPDSDYDSGPTSER